MKQKAKRKEEKVNKDQSNNPDNPLIAMAVLIAGMGTLKLVIIILIIALLFGRYLAIAGLLSVVGFLTGKVVKRIEERRSI